MSQQETGIIVTETESIQKPKRGRPRKYAYPEGISDDPVERKKIANREYHQAHYSSKKGQLKEAQVEIERLKGLLAEAEIERARERLAEVEAVRLKERLAEVEIERLKGLLVEAEIERVKDRLTEENKLRREMDELRGVVMSLSQGVKIA